MDTARAMSEENVEVVRQPITVRANSRRSLDQRLFLRFPGLFALVVRALWRLSPSSRLRRAGVSRTARLSFEAVNRRDYAVAFLVYREDAETIYPPGFAALGVGGTSTQGRVARIDVQRRWDADWGDFRNELDEVIDLGDRLLALGRMVATGMSSGAAVDREVAYLGTFRAGLAIREQIFLDHSEALKTAGLSE